MKIKFRRQRRAPNETEGKPVVGNLVVVWSPASESAGHLLWQLGICLTERQHPVILADLDLYTPGLAVAANLLTPSDTPQGVLDACLAQQAPRLNSLMHPSATEGGRPLDPVLYSPEGHPLIRMLPGLLDLRGIDAVAPAHLDALASWLQSAPGWRFVAVSGAVDCAATVACLAVADRLIIYGPRHPHRPTALTEFWLMRAVHLLRSLPGVRAAPELWLADWDAATAAEMAAHLQCPVQVISSGGRRQDEGILQALGLADKQVRPQRSEILALR